jgi:hydroxypyruvate reductase
MRELLAIYEEVVKALDARKLARDAAARIPRPGDGGKIFVLGLGKVAAELFEGVRDAMGPIQGTLVVPRDAPVPAGALVIQGDHPVPDQGSLRAGESLLAAARMLRAEDTALLLISGGGSALAEAPRAGLTLSDVREINLALLRSGLPIEQMNCVRSHLSRLKGGGLARALHAAGVKRARALVAVDVPLGGVAAVSSGPAAADPTTCADALKLVREHRLPTAATRVNETLKAGEPADFVPHESLCDLRSPAVLASQGGDRAVLLESPVRGTVDAFAQRLEKLHGFFAASGELELKIPPSAPPGGRDQHLALLMALKIRGAKGAGFLAAGTDGRDGPTDAAGAHVDGTTWDEAERRGLNPSKALKEFDASRVLAELGCLLPSRHSSAHAGDLYLYRRS